MRCRHELEEAVCGDCAKPVKTAQHGLDPRGHPTFFTPEADCLISDTSVSNHETAQLLKEVLNLTITEAQVASRRSNLKHGVKGVEVSKAANEASRAEAHRHGGGWEEWEDTILRCVDLTLSQMALRVNRTRSAVQMRRSKIGAPPCVREKLRGDG